MSSADLVGTLVFPGDPIRWQAVSGSSTQVLSDVPVEAAGQADWRVIH